MDLDDTYYAFIIGFNHNSNIEGNNTIHFEIGKTTDNIDIAFVDANLGVSSTNGFIMNTTNTNSGGWASSYMRNTICPEFLDIMDSEWQDIITTCIKYTDNTGTASNLATDVTSTEDKIWLLADFEIQGSNAAYSNPYEQNYQQQYDYYANGNSSIKYAYNDTSTAITYFLRSVYYNNSTFFCQQLYGITSMGSARTGRGFSPCFMVA